MVKVLVKRDRSEIAKQAECAYCGSTLKYKPDEVAYVEDYLCYEILPQCPNCYQEDVVLMSPRLYVKGLYEP